MYSGCSRYSRLTVLPMPSTHMSYFRSLRISMTSCVRPTAKQGMMALPPPSTVSFTLSMSFCSSFLRSG